MHFPTAPRVDAINNPMFAPEKLQPTLSSLLAFHLFFSCCGIRFTINQIHTMAHDKESIQSIIQCLPLKSSSHQCWIFIYLFLAVEFTIYEILEVAQDQESSIIQCLATAPERLSPPSLFIHSPFSC